METDPGGPLYVVSLVLVMSTNGLFRIVAAPSFGSPSECLTFGSWFSTFDEVAL